MSMSRRAFLTSTAATSILASTSPAALAFPRLGDPDPGFVNVRFMDIIYETWASDMRTLLGLHGERGRSSSQSVHKTFSILTHNLRSKNKLIRLIVTDVVLDRSSLLSSYSEVPLFARYMAAEILIVDTEGNPIKLLKYGGDASSIDLTLPKYSRDRKYYEFDDPPMVWEPVAGFDRGRLGRYDYVVVCDEDNTAG